MFAIFADVRYALRQLRRSPGFAAAAIVTLALGMGATTAVFSVADAVLLRPLPYPQADRLVMVWDQLSKIGIRRMRLSAETYDAYRAGNRVFEAAAAFREEDRDLTGIGSAERVATIASGPGMLPMLGASPALGRLLNHEDGQPERANVAVISHALFVRRFGANPGALGMTLRLDDRAYTVIGVMAPEFRFGLRFENADVWTPLPPLTDRHRAQFQMLARMRPGAGIEAARASVAAAARQVENTLHPYRGPNGEDAGYRTDVISLHEQLFGEFRTGTLILFGAVSMLLLIACVNVANLLLARAAFREREIAVRRALGASNPRLIRQWMTEAGVLALLGGAAGAVLSRWGVSILKALSPAGLPGIARIAVDGRALLFLFGISGLVCLLFGIAPCLAALRTNLTLRGSRPRTKTLRILVAAEVAIALVLLTGAGLLLQSFVRLLRVDPGFRSDGLLTMQLQLSGPRYAAPGRTVQLLSELQERLAALPGVMSVSVVSRLPVASIGSVAARGGNPFSIEGRPWGANSDLNSATDFATPQIAHTQTVGLDYFRTMQIALRSGRDFSVADGPDAPRVVVVNETLARRFFPNGDALGRHLLLGAPSPGARWMTVIGVAADVKTGALDQAAMPQFYTPVAQEPPSSVAVVLRTAGPPLHLAREASGMVRLLDPDLTVFDIASMEERIEKSVGQPHFQTVLLAFFAGVALFLSAVGIYGVVAHATIQRTREIGIRMALGAEPARVVAAVLADGLRPAAAGIALGLGGAAALTSLLSSVLFDVAPGDPVTFAAAAAVLAAVALAACLAPARRAALMDPLAALRHE
jgi:putative ABC transport system permease protein